MTAVALDADAAASEREGRGTVRSHFRPRRLELLPTSSLEELSGMASLAHPQRRGRQWHCTQRGAEKVEQAVEGRLRFMWSIPWPHASCGSGLRAEKDVGCEWPLWDY